MSYENQTILRTIQGINEKYYLPSIQRKFVWSMQQIEALFDSILQGYPIGTFLFWTVEKGDNPSHIDQYVFYEFLSDYCDKGDSEFIQKKLNKPSLKEKVIAVLDGQQRLSSLYCAIRGTYAVKTSKKISPHNQYPERELYLNLLYKQKDESDAVNEFKFLTALEAQTHDVNNYWFKVKDVINWAPAVDGEAYVKKQAKEVAKKIKGEFTDLSDDKADEIADEIEIRIELLWNKLVKDELITYYEIKRSDLDEILDIFVRVNSAGTQLSKSDLVFSTIVARWEDGREKIEALLDSLNDKGDHFKFDKDFVINLCLSLMDLQQKFAVKTFTQENVNRVKASWGKIVAAISEAVDLLVEFGFSDDNLTADYIIIPVAYYLFKSGKKIRNLDATEKEDIRKFLIYGMIKKIFSAGVDGVLTSLLNALRVKPEGSEEYVLRRPEAFDFEALRKLKFQDRALDIDATDLESVLDLKKGPLSFMVLSLLYPQIKFNEVKWHQDHIHPKTLFDKKKLNNYLKSAGEEFNDTKLSDWKLKSDTIVNLQLLTGSKNQEKGKTQLSVWIASQFHTEEEIESYTKANYIDKSVGFEQYKFDYFYNARRLLLKTKLAEILNINLSDADSEDGNNEECIGDTTETTIADAIHKVLSEHPEGLTVQEIYDKITEQNLFTFGAKNPKSVVYITIQRWCIGSKISRACSVKLFKVVQEVDGEIYYGITTKDDLGD